MPLSPLWSSECRWNKSALKATYQQGLNPVILTELVYCEEQTSLNLLIDLDQLLWNSQGPKVTEEEKKSLTSDPLKAYI